MSEWRKSTFSEPNNNECVEVRYSTEAVGVRDTKYRAAGMLAFEPGTWTAFVSSLEPRNAR